MTEPALEPTLAFLQRLWRLNHAIERLSMRMDRSLGVTTQQRLLLRCIGRTPNATAGQLAKLLHVDPGTLSTALPRLEQKGLVERTRDRADSRRWTLTLTEAGRALDRPTDGTLEDAVGALLAEIPPEQAVTLLGGIDRLTELVDASEPLGPG